MAQDQSLDTRFKKISSAAYTFIRWFDSYAGLDQISPEEKPKVDWPRIVPFIGVHLVCLGAIWTGWSWTAVSVAVFLYFVRIFGITAFYHRYFSHRSFKTSRCFQFLGAVLGNSSGQRGPLWWAAHHRVHHAHSDTEEDVHSPHQHGFLWSHMGWFTSRTHFPTNFQAIGDFYKYPELRFLDRFDWFIPLVLATSLFFLGKYLEVNHPALGTSGPQLLIWGFFISTVVVFHGTCTINSLAHVIGKKRFRTDDESKNSLILALITLGEGWHNNHHRYPASVRQGFYWWEIDITYYLLTVLSWTGLIWDIRPVPKSVLIEREALSENAVLSK